MNISRSIGACLLGTAVAFVPLLTVPNADVASAAPVTSLAEASSSIDFAVTSQLVYAPGGQLTVTGVAPLHENVWATISGTDRNAVVAFDTGDGSASWTLQIPIEHTTGKDQVSLDFHYGERETITRVFTATGVAAGLEVTSSPVYAPDEVLVVSGTAPRLANVWATIAGTNPEDVVAFAAGNDQGAWTLQIPFEHTQGKDEVALDFHAVDKTVTQTFAASADAATPFEVTSRPVFFPGRGLTVTGTALAHQNVWATVNGSDRNAVIAFDSGDENASWTLDIPQRYTVGKERLDLDFHYGADKTITRTFTAEVTAAPIAVATKTFVKGQRQLVTGTAERYAVIEVWSEDELESRIVADHTGAWRYTTTTPVRDDSYTRTLKSQGTKDVEFTLTADGDETTPITVMTKTFVAGERQLIEGTAEPYAVVEVWFGNRRLMNVAADENGNWHYTTGAAITDDIFTRTLKTKGAKDVTFTLTAEQSTVAPITVTTKTFTTGQKQKIEGTAQPGARVNVYFGTKYLMNVTADKDGNWNYTTGAPITDDTFTRTLKSAGTTDHTFTLTAAK